MFLEVLKKVALAEYLINCHRLSEGFRASQIIIVASFVVVSSVGIKRINYKYFQIRMNSLVGVFNLMYSGLEHKTCFLWSDKGPIVTIH